MTHTTTRAALRGRPEYVVMKATEASNWSLVHEALRVHASGYLSMGFVHDDAVTADGTIDPEIDQSRGDNTEYYLAVNAGAPDDRATLRKVRFAAGASVEDFDAYQLCARTLHAEGHGRLQAMLGGVRPLAEISGLARTPGASPAAVWHILRAAVHDALRKEEVWFCCLVVSTYDSLVRHLGTSFLGVLGDDVTIKDARVSSSIALRPVLIDTVLFLDSVLADVEQADGARRARLARSLIFFSDGIDDSLLSPQVAAFKANATG